ncbi:MAG: restriction endonuclease [Actinobacteria bacterium]|nr:restriction endonuclease [Actinomycetota bacterium]
MELNEIAQRRLDANEIGEIDFLVAVSEDLEEPSRLLREYRHRFDKKRRQLVRDAILEAIDEVDADLRRLGDDLDGPAGVDERVESPVLAGLNEHVAQIRTLLGTSSPVPPRWGDLLRHLHFGLYCDVRDVMDTDWPAVKAGLRSSLYGETEPVPVQVTDLSELVNAKPGGPVASRLNWVALSEEDFERLVFALISSESGYENPQWLTKTSAADRGRDLSVDRVHTDPLAGTTRQRVIVQCKHWLAKSISPAEVALLKEQMRLNEPPKVDVCVIATSGRFTSDAIQLIETHNVSDTGLRMEMWPESHLELLLAGRPWLIAQFRLR